MTAKRVRRVRLFEDFICEPILFQGASSPTMNFPTRPLSAEAFRTARTRPDDSRPQPRRFLPERPAAEGVVQLHREIEVGYCRLVTISTDNITETNEYRSGVDAHLPFLSDAGRIVQKDLDIAEYTDPEHNPMIPHVIVLEPGLVIFKIYNGYWCFGRPTIEERRPDLRAVLKKCRPDWQFAQTLTWPLRPQTDWSNQR